MSEIQKLIMNSYENAKKGKWEKVISEWKEIPLLARRCSRYQKSSSGWTFLHQAAYFGHEAVCIELIRLGADPGRLSHDGKAAADVACENGHGALGSLLKQAMPERDSLWAPSSDPDLLPGSNQWNEAEERWAAEFMLVAYGGGVVKIPKGGRFFVDSFDRVLVGWHGTYDPPCGMDGESMIWALTSREAKAKPDA